MKNDTTPRPEDKPDHSAGWFPSYRSDEALELLRVNHHAFVLAYVIGLRARWKEGFNRFGLVW